MEANVETLKDVFWTLYSKLDAVLQGFRVAYEVALRIAEVGFSFSFGGSVGRFAFVDVASKEVVSRGFDASWLVSNMTDSPHPLTSLYAASGFQGRQYRQESIG